MGSLPANAKVLARRSIDLRRLYLHAADVSEPGLRLVLSENVKTLDLLIDDLQAQLCAVGLKSPARGSWRGRTHRHLARWLMHAAPRGGTGWIRLLAHRERALLRAFEQAIPQASVPAASTLRRQLTRLHSIHLDIDILAGITRY